MVRPPCAQEKARKSECEDEPNLPPIPVFALLRQTGLPAAENRQRDAGKPEGDGYSTGSNRTIAGCCERSDGEQQSENDYPSPAGRDREPTSEAVNRHVSHPFPD